MRKTIFIASAVVMILTGCGGEKQSPPDNTFTDKRDGQVYKTVKIGSQTWMAENLNYAAQESKCYENKTDNCDKYGRLYDWATAKNACPSGWHLPSDAEWTILTDYVGGEDIAGTKLKSSNGWNSYKGVPTGTDAFGFSALPGGYGYSGGSFVDAGYDGSWWSATEDDASYAWYQYMYYDNEYVRRNYNGKTGLFSVRCLQD